jgi:hypothetical protein
VAPPAGPWEGRHVKVVDGPGLSMPDTPANRQAYPQPADRAPGVGFPLLRLEVVFSLATGLVLEAAVGTRRGDRRAGWPKPQRPAWVTPEGYASYPEWIRLRALRLRVRRRGCGPGRWRW